MAQSLISQEYNVIIDNTNTMKKEYQKYVDLAEENGYTVIYYVANFNGKAFDKETKKWNVNFLYDNNVHKVPKETIQKMADRFEWEN